MKKLLPLLIALAFVFIGIYVLRVNYATAPSPDTALPELSGRTYMNDIYGIAFHYGEGYVLEEGERGDARQGHYAIVLTRTEDASPRENGEGPPTISIDIYQNNGGEQALFEWLRGSNTSNFNLSDGTYVSTEISGVEAVSYRWSGLYEGETTAFLHKGNVVAVTVTALTPEDANRTVYRQILNSFQLN